MFGFRVPTTTPLENALIRRSIGGAGTFPQQKVGVPQARLNASPAIRPDAFPRRYSPVYPKMGGRQEP